MRLALSTGLLALVASLVPQLAHGNPDTLKRLDSHEPNGILWESDFGCTAPVGNPEFEQLRARVLDANSGFPLLVRIVDAGRPNETQPLSDHQERSPQLSAIILTPGGRRDMPASRDCASLVATTIETLWGLIPPALDSPDEQRAEKTSSPPESGDPISAEGPRLEEKSKLRRRRRPPSLILGSNVTGQMGPFDGPALGLSVHLMLAWKNLGLRTRARYVRGAMTPVMDNAPPPEFDLHQYVWDVGPCLMFSHGDVFRVPLCVGAELGGTTLSTTTLGWATQEKPFVVSGLQVAGYAGLSAHIGPPNRHVAFSASIDVSFTRRAMFEFELFHGNATTPVSSEPLTLRVGLGLDFAHVRNRSGHRRIRSREHERNPQIARTTPREYTQ